MDNPAAFVNENISLQFIHQMNNQGILSWKTDVFKIPDFRQCLTSAELIDEKGIVTALDISEEDVDMTVDGCFTSRLSVRYKYQEIVFLTVVTEVAAVSVCLDSPGYSGQFGERQFNLGLGIILTVLLLCVGIGVCKRKKKNRASDDTAGVQNNRVNILPTTHDLPDVT